MQLMTSDQARDEEALVHLLPSGRAAKGTQREAWTQREARTQRSGGL